MSADAVGSGVCAEPDDGSILMPQQTRFYAGIGSRRTPLEILDLMAKIAGRLAREGYVLRTGDAQGADAAFLRGAQEAGGRAEVYTAQHAEGRDDALRLAERLHPAWECCSPFSRLLLARNGFQVLGLNLRSPAAFVVCWTPGGRLEGGTAQALRLARLEAISVHNLGFPARQEAAQRWVTEEVRSAT